MPADSSRSQQHLKAINRALASGTYTQVRQLINNLPGAEVAHLLERLRPVSGKRAAAQQGAGNRSAPVSGRGSPGRAPRNLSTDELVSLVEELDTDDLADLLQELPDHVTSQDMASLDEQNRERLEHVMSYPVDTAGGIMNTDVITVRPEITFEVVQRYLRLRGDIPRTTDNLAVVNRKNQFIGLLPLTKVLISDPGTTVREAMITDIQSIPATMPDSEVAKIFERHDLVTAPVVDEDGMLVGRITIDDVVDVIMEEADHSLMSSTWMMTRTPSVLSGRQHAAAPVAGSTCSLRSQLPPIGLFELPLEKWWPPLSSCPLWPAWAASPAARH